MLARKNIVKAYKQPELYYKNSIHFYNTCKKLLNYKADDEILIEICKQLYKEDVINYKENTLAKGVGLCSLFYFKLKEKLEPENVTKDDIDFHEILELTYKNFNSIRNDASLREQASREYGSLLEEESWGVIDSLVNVPGVYFLYSEEGVLGYVGRSYNLSSRIKTSLRERGLKNFKYAITKTKADANIYEVYYISKYRPFFNGDCVVDDEPTIELPELKLCKKLYYLNI